MNTFKENLQAVPQADQTVLLRLYNPKDDAIGVGGLAREFDLAGSRICRYVSLFTCPLPPFRMK